jgi:cation diffusion facilitator CzcD-associated flavoprotein CzcO
MTFNTEVVKAQWDEDSAKWKLHLRQTNVATGQTTDIQDECDVLLHATGVLNNFKWPEIKGIEKFKGKVVHTARWPEEYQSEEWAKERIAVIGSGASSIQTVPNMQPHVKSMEIFIRTGVWFVDIAGNEGKNIPYTDQQKRQFASDPKELVKHAKFLEDQVNGVWSVMLKGTPEAEMAKDLFIQRTAGIIKDKRLLEGIIPKFAVGCRYVPIEPQLLQQTTN